MTANVETIAYMGKTPWHGLGTKLEEKHRFSIEDGLKLSGLDWQVELVPLHINDRDEDGEIVKSTSVKEFAQAVRRVKDGHVIGCVGPRYHCLQNKDAFEWFRPLFENKLCGLNTAGSLGNGEKVWILADIMDAKQQEIVKGDVVRRYLLLSNSHNGTTSVRVSFTDVRVVCSNTLAAAHSSANSKFIRLRHGKGLAENLDKVREILNLANQEFEATADQYRFLASRRVNEADLRKFVKVMTGNEDVAEADISTRAKNTMERMIKLMVDGIGSDIPGVRGTYWGMYQGYNQFLNYEASRTSSARLDSLWFGKGFNENLKALELATEMATAA
jgi:phage/plasmid-like protein (TIGR03299 family)